MALVVVRRLLNPRRLRLFFLFFFLLLGLAWAFRGDVEKNQDDGYEAENVEQKLHQLICGVRVGRSGTVGQGPLPFQEVQPEPATKSFSYESGDARRFHLDVTSAYLESAKSDSTNLPRPSAICCATR